MELELELELPVNKEKIDQMSKDTIISKMVDLNYDMVMYGFEDKEMRRGDYMRMVNTCLELQKSTSGETLKEVIRLKTRINNWYMVKGVW